MTEAPKKEMIAYRIECDYTTTGDTERKQFGFTHITPEPIETHHSYILNIVCNNIGIPFEDLCSNYFDLQIFRTGKV